MNAYHFRKPQPLSLRLWHWLNAAVVLGLLGTVILRKTLLSWRSNSALIEAKLREAGTLITPELAREIAVQIRNPLWEWHLYLGYALGVLLVGRILIALVVEKQLPLAHAVRSAIGIRALPDQERPHALHYSLVKLGYAALYAGTLLMVISGGLLTFKTVLSLSPDVAGRIKEIHEMAQWFFVVFIGVHFAGVLIAENRQDAGIVSDMIHG